MPFALCPLTLSSALCPLACLGPHGPCALCTLPSLPSAGIMPWVLCIRSYTLSHLPSALCPLVTTLYPLLRSHSSVPHSSVPFLCRLPCILSSPCPLPCLPSSPCPLPCLLSFLCPLPCPLSSLCPLPFLFPSVLFPVFPSCPRPFPVPWSFSLFPLPGPYRLRPLLRDCGPRMRD
jgi:hypothetical protein